MLSAPLGFFRYLQWSEGAYFTFKANFLSSRHSVSNYLLCTQRVLPNLCTATKELELFTVAVECRVWSVCAAGGRTRPALPGHTRPVPSVSHFSRGLSRASIAGFLFIIILKTSFVDGFKNCRCSRCSISLGADDDASLPCCLVQVWRCGYYFAKINTRP